MSDRNPSKQRRAAQNRSARQALATRTTRAAQPSRPPTPVQATESEPTASGKSRSRRSDRPSGSTRDGAKGSSRTNLRGEAPVGRNGRPARTAAAVPVRRATNPVSRVIAEVQAVPGGKGVFFALMFSIVAGLMIMFARITPQEVMNAPGLLVEAYRKANGLKPPAGLDSRKAVFASDYALVVLGPLAVAIAVVPVVITATTFALARQENRRRNFTAAAFILFLFVIGVAGPLSIYFFFSLGGLVYGAFKARQAEPAPERPVRPSRFGRNAGARKDGDAVGSEDGFDDED